MKKCLLLVLLLLVLAGSLMGLTTNLWLSATPLSPERYVEVKHAIYLLGSIAIVALFGTTLILIPLIRDFFKRKPHNKQESASNEK